MCSINLYSKTIVFDSFVVTVSIQVTEKRSEIKEFDNKRKW